MFGLLRLEKFRLSFNGASCWPVDIQGDLDVVVCDVAGPGQRQLSQPLVKLLICRVISSGSAAQWQVATEVSGAAGRWKTEFIFGFELFWVESDGR